MVEQFTNEAINILLMWTIQEEIHGLTYNIIVSPQVNIQYTRMKTVHLILPYNIRYNVSIAALCGETSSLSLHMELNYGKSLSNIMTTVQTHCSNVFFMLFMPTTQLNVLIHLVY